MSIFNPVIGDKNLHCRCQHCFHGFWLRDIDSALKCYCELSHSVIFGTGLDNIAFCSGASDAFSFTEKSKNSVVCTHCNNALWLKSDKNILRCICLHLQCVVFDSTNKKISPIANCNGVAPLQEVPNFPKATNLDIFKKVFFIGCKLQPKKLTTKKCLVIILVSNPNNKAAFAYIDGLSPKVYSLFSDM